MEFRLLGAVEAAIDGHLVELGRRRERALLALLLLEGGRAVSVDRLVGLLWEDEPPGDARKAIQVAVSRLRRSLEPAGDHVKLVSHAAGYAIDADPDSIDLHRFTGLVAAARRSDDPVERAATLGDALDLWKGPPLAGLDMPWLTDVIGIGLDETRLSAIELRVEADLAAGRHDKLLAELADLTVQHPARERLVAARMLALYRTGRRRDALDAYQRTAGQLAEELGLDPGPGLRELHTAILRDDPDLAPPTPPPATQPAHTRVRPAQLPADLSTFTGRDAELDRLLALTEDRRHPSAVVITAIDGMAGIGKTTLAVHAAHRLAARYPDGQLFLDLHGFTEDVRPVDPDDALDRLLHSLGVPGADIPADTDDRAALYRSLLADKALLVVLDNAANEAQVQPLLPAAPRCLVLITSRRRLAGLDEANPVSLDVLPSDDAIALFTHTAGAHRLTDHPRDLVAEVVELCGHLPLAIRIAAARLRHRPAWTLTNLVQRLRDQRHRLTELGAGHRSVTAALDLSYQQLAPDQRRMFRLLGLHPGPDIDTNAAAALADTTVHHAERLLDDLLDAHLLHQHQAGRYRFHDLVRAHAAHAAAAEETDPDRRAARTRLFDHYAHTAAAAMDVLYPHEIDRRPRTLTPDAPVPAVTDHERAAAWLDTELTNLLATTTYAAEYGPPTTHTIHVSVTLHRHLRTRALHADAATLHTQALRAARQTGDRPGELSALNDLGRIQFLQGRHKPAAGHLQRALYLARSLDDRTGELHALICLGDIEHARGMRKRAADGFERALHIARSIGDRNSELDALRSLGDYLRLQGRHEPAANCYQQMLAIARATGNLGAQLDALHGLGHIHRVQGSSKPAATCFEQALHLARTTGHRNGELHALTGLGDVHHSQGQYERAMRSFERAMQLARATGNRNYQFEALHGLGHSYHAIGDFNQALTHHQAALDLARELRQPADQARAHDGLARAYRALHQHQQARQHWQQALDILTDLDLTEDEEVNADDVRTHLTELDQHDDSFPE